jgi:hypothetical protein|tara:strand:- start:593 stop:772 length:180 start_codon:yes stop_codon:yes gene_type:complete
MEKAKDKLWVFDTQQYLEVYAPTLQDAQREVAEVEKQSGLDFDLHREWQIYQDQHEEAA